MFFHLLVPAFRSFIHLISRMAKPITSISCIALRSVMSIPLPLLATSLGTPRLRAPIVSLSNNSMAHRDPVPPTPLQRAPYSHSPTPRSSLLVDGLAPMVTSMECIVSLPPLHPYRSSQQLGGCSDQLQVLSPMKRAGLRNQVNKGRSRIWDGHWPL